MIRLIYDSAKSKLQFATIDDEAMFYEQQEILQQSEQDEFPEELFEF